METKALIFFRVLLNRYREGSADAILKNLPQDEVKKILALDIHSKDTSPAFVDPLQLISLVHYSWLVKPFLELSTELQTYVLASLPSFQAQGICKMVSMPYEPFAISVKWRPFFLMKLLNKLEIRSLLPLPYLPQTQLIALVGCSKQQLVELIDFLGLYDLAIELRQVVDKRILKQVYECLNRKKQVFLRAALHQIDKFTPPKLGLETNMMDCRKLETILHRRGIIRLAAALSDQHPHLRQYLYYILDTGRSSLLKKYPDKEVPPNIAAALAAQTMNTLNFLLQSSEGKRD